jgi:hypothetical protein
MCWSILYHENKITLNKAISDYTNYEKVDILEKFKCSFQVDKVNIKNKIYYHISHKQCACDFFNKKNTNLQEEFKNFILKRMENECIESYIFVKWVEKNNDLNVMPDKTVNIGKDNLLNIFTTDYKEIHYCVKRNNGKNKKQWKKNKRRKT